MISIAAEEGASGFNVLFPAVYDIVWSLVVFVVIGLFFWKFVIPQFRKVLDQREEQIEGGIRKAEQAQKEAASNKAEHEELLKSARVEAAEIRDQARAEAEQIRAEKKAELQAELDRQTAAAKAQIEAERQAAIVSLRSEVGSLAVDLASRVVGESLTNDQRSTALVDRFLADLDSAPAAGTQN
ncbi:F0F1 ATP synthase subunit B [Pseudoclavibacter chungangensis]|uniref:ATP synthase subunit b n=1 Tax=Pseudoclavibacter chungangensis TaxID=587635 RepID=A0A7J5BUZ2_9MICO|nr:F0F1 ATP synthase subunit B [Pseudoclavibacter chungangensis]KAB1657318.1 F0F1 ATP synthase subunit B [Pseudoclavibacter chungangensis]NYJ66230.1 F-type H+-transporting ATPase subunit b [Pseudoclavibacter chungangensis]